MPDTAPRCTVQTVLDFILKRDRKHDAAETPYDLNDFAEAADMARMVAHLEGKPFHMAADLLGVSPALLEGVLIGAAARDAEIAKDSAEPDVSELLQGVAELRAAVAMYQAENAPAITPADVGPGMTNAALADLLDGLPLAGLSELDRAALDEAAQRIRERQDEEEG